MRAPFDKDQEGGSLECWTRDVGAHAVIHGNASVCGRHRAEIGVDTRVPRRPVLVLVLEDLKRGYLCNS